MTAISQFERGFQGLTGNRPFAWQTRLFEDYFKRSRIPLSLDVPTGLGKTSVMAIWYLSRRASAQLPRRLVYVVDRRTVVDQATDVALSIRERSDDPALRISTLRGRFVDNRDWHADPSAPAIIIGTVDMIGSRLLFSGYGASRRMRPYHAGLLGTDTLLVLDEAHLVPAFARLLRAVEQDDSLWPRAPADRAMLPGFLFLPLSATQRQADETIDERVPFQLEPRDWAVDSRARTRLEAAKRLRLVQLEDRDPNRQVAEAAWELATQGGRFARVLVFCDRRDAADGGGRLTAARVASELNALADGRSYELELLVGARRTWERNAVLERLKRLGFIGQTKSPAQLPAFLVATSAGEVGADIDADHMVCDLVEWERMVQRLGRVNRRGEGAAEVRVFWSEATAKAKGEVAEADEHALRAGHARAVLEQLPPAGNGFDASPGALRGLAELAREGTALAARIKAASTPEPLRPALNRALVDAWSLTSLETHPGRPDVAPWLRGWDAEDRQTTVIWRTHLPARRNGDVSKTEADDFFEAAPPHESEKLDTETYRVAEWLHRRSIRLLRGAREPVPDEPARSGVPEPDTSDAQASETPPDSVRPVLAGDDAIALLLRPDDSYAGRCYTLKELAQERKGKAKEEFDAELVGKIVVVRAAFGGLSLGLLQADSDEIPKTADSSPDWSKVVGFRVRRFEGTEPEPDPEWPRETTFVVHREADGEAVEGLLVEHFLNTAGTEDGRSLTQPEGLREHQERVRQEALRIADGLALPGNLRDALAVAARLHDAGKAAPRWQRAFNAARDEKKCGIARPLAKTRGPINQAVLSGYRHEFGSLFRTETQPEFNALSVESRDLVLHLIAAHHGQARPLIDVRGCDDGPPSVLEQRACEVALRFARLQRRWGPWGLAWLEALLRAADQKVSSTGPIPERLEREGAA